MIWLVKPLLVRDRLAVRTVKSSPGRGVRLWLNRRSSLQVELGLYETELNPLYREGIPWGGLVYDIGAGDGFTALLFAKLGGRVVAFEPRDSALGLLDRNLALNPDLASRIEVVRDAYSPRTGPVPVFVKVDVDGAEVEVLRLLPKDVPRVVVETHSIALEQECQALLRQRGYRVSLIRNAWWRRFYPEYRPIEQNRWLLAQRGRVHLGRSAS